MGTKNKEVEFQIPDKCFECDMPEEYKENAYGRCGYCHQREEHEKCK